MSRQKDPFANAKDAFANSRDAFADPFADVKDALAGSDPNLDSRFSTALKRQGEEQSARQGLAEAAKKALLDPKITPERRATMERIIQRHSPIGMLDVAPTVGENIKRGLGGVVGAFPQMFAGISDLAGAAVNAVTPGQPLQGLRRASQNYSAEIQEAYGDKGVAGLIGNIGGTFGLGAVVSGASKIPKVGLVAKALLAPANVYGKAAQTIGKVIPPVGRALASESRVTRMAAAALADLPINVAQGISQEGSTPESIAKVALLGSATSAVGGALIGKPNQQKIPTKVPEPNKLTTQIISGSAEAMLKEGSTKAEVMKAKKQAVSQGKKIAKAAWLEANPGKSWEKDLAKNDQVRLIQEAINSGAASQAPVPPAQTAGLPGGETATIVQQAEIVPPARERRLIDVLAKARTQTREANAERRIATKEAATDRLTGLPNQSAWEKARIRIEQDPNTAVAQLDFNNFKTLNDTKGHDTGNQALRDFGEQLGTIAEKNKVQVFRSGGDEFVFAGPHERVTAARDAAEKLHDTYDGVKVSISGAVGENIASTEAELAARKIQHKTEQGMALTRGVANEALQQPEGTTADLHAMPKDEFLDNWAGAVEQKHSALPQYEQVAKERGITLPSAPDHSNMQETWDKIQNSNLSPEEAHAMGSNLRQMDAPELKGFDQVYKELKGKPDLTANQIRIVSNLEQILNTSGVPSAAPARSLPIPDPVPAPTGQPSGPRPGTEPLQAPPRSPEDFLVNVQHEKPLREMSSDELDGVKDQLWTQIEQHPPGKVPAELIADLDRISKATVWEQQAVRESTPNPEGYKAFTKELSVPNADEPITVKQYSAYNDLEIVKGKPAPVESPGMTPADFGRLVRLSETKLSLDVKRSLLTELEIRTASMVKSDAAQYLDKMNKLRSSIAHEIDPPNKSGFNAYTRHETVGGIIGFFYGMTTDDDPQEAMKYAILFGLIGAGAAHAGGRLINPKSKASVVPKDVLSTVKTSEELAGLKPKSNFFETMRGIYQRNVRPALGGELFMKDIAQGRLIPSGADAGKELASYGKHLAYTENWIADKPFWVNEDGSIELVPTLGVYTDAKGQIKEINNASDIIKAVDGDVDGLGKFAAARTVLEIFKIKGKKTTGVDLMESARLVSYMEQNHPNYVAAADASRQLHIALLEGMVRGGVVSREAKDLMGQEQFYAALERAFGSVTPGGEVGAKKSTNISSSNPVKARTGGADVPIKNPIETMVANIVRVQRAIEINRLKNMTVDAAESNPEIGKLWINRIDRNKRGPDGKLLVDPVSDTRVEQLRNDLGISDEDAKSMVSNFKHEAMDPTSPTMTLYRGGTLRTYRLEGALADSFRALSPPEMSDILKMIGSVTNIARSGIVKNPIFILRQAWRDNFQGLVNSQNGFIGGVDWLKGWWELASHSAKAKEFQRYGGGHTSLSFSDVLTPQGALTTAKAPGKNTLDTAILRVKELKLGEAYRTLMVPMAEAARMGEYLRARGRGAGAQDAVFAAKSVVGNFQQTAGTLRALNQMALFVGPSIQALDQSVFAMGLHPFRPAPDQKGFNIGNLSLGKNVIEGRKAAALNYFVKGFVAIALPSLALRAMYHDDKEVMDLSNSEFGRGFWFYRINGTIHKSAKPIFEGQVFGTTAEMAFDKYKNDDAAGAGELARALGHDAAINLLPLIGTVGFSLWSNKDYNYGGPVVSGGNEVGSPEFQTNPNTSIPARVIGKALAPVSNALQNIGADMLARTLGPAGIDYVVRNLGGTLAGDAMIGVGQALQYKQTGMVPPVEEWPIIRGALVKYPSMNVASVQEFYNDAERVARVGHDVATLTEKGDPVGLTQYLQQHMSDVMKIELYTDMRKQINDLRQSIQDMKDAPAGSFPPESIRQFERQMTLQMIELTQITNTTARLIR